MKINILTILFILFSSSLFAQSSGRSEDALNSLKKKERRGDLVIMMDTLIEDNYNKHLVQNNKDKGIEGYRIRIYSNTGHGAREMQLRIRAKFMSLYPDISAYGPYDDIYFKVYIGDFRTKRDALKILGDISKNFPDAFIVKDKIVIEE